MATDSADDTPELSNVEARAIEMFGDSDGFEVRDGRLYPKLAHISKSGGEKPE